MSIGTSWALIIFEELALNLISHVDLAFSPSPKDTYFVLQILRPLFKFFSGVADFFSFFKKAGIQYRTSFFFAVKARVFWP